MDLPVELLELILLQTDTRTLLTAQRVCRLWRDVIQAHRGLQQALFFEPSQPLEPGLKPVKNSLVEESVWPYFLRVYLHPQSQHAKAMARADRRDSRRDASFLRREASWRQMLLAQPPTNNYAFIMCETRSLLSRRFFLGDLTGVPMRMGDLEASIGAGRLVPTPEAWTLWLNTSCAPFQWETLAIAYHRHWKTGRIEKARQFDNCDVVYLEIWTARYLEYYQECPRLTFESWLKLWVNFEDGSWI
ncbi:hypothetical protein BJX96DRAFT_179309 [Aspergillus floccosus]